MKDHVTGMDERLAIGATPSTDAAVGGDVVVIAGATADSGGKPELASEPSPKQKACGRGMVRTRSGACVAARPRLPDAGELGIYYQRAQRYRDYPGQPGLPGQPQDIR